MDGDIYNILWRDIILCILRVLYQYEVIYSRPDLICLELECCQVYRISERQCLKFLGQKFN